MRREVIELKFMHCMIGEYIKKLHYCRITQDFTRNNVFTVVLASFFVNLKSTDPIVLKLLLLLYSVIKKMNHIFTCQIGFYFCFTQTTSYIGKQKTMEIEIDGGRVVCHFGTNKIQIYVSVF